MSLALPMFRRRKRVSPFQKKSCQFFHTKKSLQVTTLPPIFWRPLFPLQQQLVQVTSPKIVKELMSLAEKRKGVFLSSSWLGWLGCFFFWYPKANHFLKGMVGYQLDDGFLNLFLGKWLLKQSPFPSIKKWLALGFQVNTPLKAQCMARYTRRCTSKARRLSRRVFFSFYPN